MSIFSLSEVLIMEFKLDEIKIFEIEFEKAKFKLIFELIISNEPSKSTAIIPDSIAKLLIREQLDIIK